MVQLHNFKIPEVVLCSPKTIASDILMFYTLIKGGIMHTICCRFGQEPRLLLGSPYLAEDHETDDQEHVEGGTTEGDGHSLCHRVFFTAPKFTARIIGAVILGT